MPFRLTYLGQCGFLIEAGDARILTDPCLSDYVHQHNWKPETPWERLYPAPGTIADYRPDGILISHSHDDHMDPDAIRAYSEAGGCCEIAAPAPECGLLASFGAKNIRRAKAGETFQVKGVKVTPVPCAHQQLHRDENGDYRELSYILEYEGERIFFAGDATLYPELENWIAGPFSAMLLPVNGADSVRDALGIIGNMDAMDAAKLAKSHGAVLVAMHHDLFAINYVTHELIRAAAAFAGAKVLIPALSEPFAV